MEKAKTVLLLACVLLLASAATVWANGCFETLQYETTITLQGQDTETWTECIAVCIGEEEAIYMTTETMGWLNIASSGKRWMALTPGGADPSVMLFGIVYGRGNTIAGYGMTSDGETLTFRGQLSDGCEIR